MNNAAIVRQLYDAFAHGDVSSALGALDPQVEWRVPSGSPYAGIYRSPQAVAEQVFGRLMQEWDDWQMSVDQVLDAGEHVVVLGTESGTHRRTGRRAEASAAHVLRLRNGKVVAFTDYVDTHAVAQATVG